ncbi:MAG: hypothetical protein E7575_06235 [Ruminococcaceae bacterium]|nr:hypothetical protein [Oscillospiraceae bacterium]
MKTEKTLIGIAIGLIVAGALAIVLTSFNFFGLFDKGSAPSSDETTQESLQHEPVEYFYDNKDRIKSEVYYENNVYNGQKDYFYNDRETHIMIYDSEKKLCENIKSVVNAVGNLTLEEKYKDGKQVSSLEIVYHDDLVTPKKETLIEYTDKGEEATKTFYDEDGNTVSVSKYLDGELTEEKLYQNDEGNANEN